MTPRLLRQREDLLGDEHPMRVQQDRIEDPGDRQPGELRRGQRPGTGQHREEVGRREGELAEDDGQRRGPPLSDQRDSPNVARAEETKRSTWEVAAHSVASDARNPEPPNSRSTAS